MTEKMENAKPLDDFKITIAVPHSYETVYKQWFASYETLIKPRHVALYFEPSLPLDVNRNACVRKAQETDSEYIFFIDHDNVMDPHMLVRLLQYNVPIVGALYFERGYPHLPVVYTFPSDEEEEEQGTVKVLHDYPKGLIQVDVIGLGCSLFKMEVFEKIPYPWFSYEYKGNKWGTEDIAFFHKAKDYNIPVYIDTEHTCGHLSVYEVTEGDWLFHKEAYLKEVQKKMQEWNTKSVFLNKGTMDLQKKRNTDV